MERCSKCILPSDYPGITLDDNSVCNYCNDYESFHAKLGKEKLLNDLNHRSSTDEYDCIVPISGGKDSTFILYYIVKELDLKPLAVNYNSGLQNPYAKENILNACSILNVDLISEKSRVTNKLIRQILMIGIKQKARPRLGKLCQNCETMLRSLAIRSAKKFNVKYIIWGSSALESGNNDQYIQYKNTYKNNNRKNEPSVFSKLKYKTKKFIKAENKFSKLIYRFNNYTLGWYIPFSLVPRAIYFNILSILQRLEMRVPFKYAIRSSKVVPFTKNNPKFIHFYDYIEWNAMYNVRLLKKELKWKHPLNKEDRFDCLYHGLPNLYSLKENNITADGINYCNFIREDKLTREEALEKEMFLQSNIKSECDQILEKVKLNKYQLP